jgi:uncharacterized membrane protein (DUF106 family)
MPLTKAILVLSLVGIACGAFLLLVAYILGAPLREMRRRDRGFQKRYRQHWKRFDLQMVEHLERKKAQGPSSWSEHWEKILQEYKETLEKT